MELGFDTIGHATVIAYDQGPILVTDPWFEGDAYFGSWVLSHEVPEEQREAIRSAPFCWISHGHPDHLSMGSLATLRADTVILLPDHVGGRIARDLGAAGFRVRVLPDRTWVRLSERVSVCCLADYNQDALLLIDVGGRLVVDLNDCAERGWRRFVRDVVARYEVSFLLQLASFGDPDMINLFDEDGNRIEPRAALREPPGRTLALSARSLGTRYVVPFSTMHQYQRADSAWANEYVTTVDDYGPGFDIGSAELLPAYIRYDCITDTATPIDPPERPLVVRDPVEFGDRWDEPLEQDDRAALDRYVRSIHHLGRRFDFIAFRVGGVEHTVALRDPSSGARRRGFTFDAPRASLMAAVRHRVFDDLLIANFARTTVHGPPDREALYPDFTPYVGKYADNGDARSAEELRAYFRAYRHRAPYDYLRHRLERHAVDRVRGWLPRGSAPYSVARRAYRAVTAGR